MVRLEYKKNVRSDMTLQFKFLYRKQSIFLDSHNDVSLTVNCTEILFIVAQELTVKSYS